MTFDDLRAAVAGPVLLPADSGFSGELAGANLAVHDAPDLVVGAATITDVQAAVRYAAEQRMHVSVLATGHGSQLPVIGGMVITTKRLKTIETDKTDRIARVGAGVLAGELATAAARLGLAPIAGSATTVGFTGLVLGGGLGPLARSHGYASDYVTQFTVVTPDGQVTIANSVENPDLFWALRGGKGGFGVVVETRVKLVELPSLYGGFVAFDEPDIDRVLRGWVEWTHTAPANVTTSVAIVRFPPVPAIPEFMRGKTFLMLRVAYPGPAAEGERLAAPLLALATPAFGSLGEMPADMIGAIHNDPTEPLPVWGEGMLLNDLDDAFVTTLLANVGEGKETPFMIVELRHLGAATRVDVPEGSAVGGRSADFSCYIVGVPDPSLFDTVLPAAYEHLVRSIDKYVAPENFINWWSGRDLRAYEASWTSETFWRLGDLRRQWDPEGIFSYPS